MVFSCCQTWRKRVFILGTKCGFEFAQDFVLMHACCFNYVVQLVVAMLLDVLSLCLLYLI